MGITMKNCKVELSTDGTTWVDVSDEANQVAVSGFDLETEGVGVFGVAKKEHTVGGHALGTVSIRAMYRENTTEAWGLAEAAHTGRSALYVRWSPRGGTTGHYRFTSDAGYVTAPVWPGGEDGPASIMPEIKIETPFVTKSTVA